MNRKGDRAGVQRDEEEDGEEPAAGGMVTGGKGVMYNNIYIFWVDIQTTLSFKGKGNTNICPHLHLHVKAFVLLECA